MYKSYLSLISEADSSIEKSFQPSVPLSFSKKHSRLSSLGGSSSSTRASDFSPSGLSTASPSFNIQTPCSSQIFKVRNLDTGEEIDLREEGRESFVEDYAKILKVQSNKARELKEF
jgi:hypothetical protein